MIQWYWFALSAVIFRTLFQITRKKALLKTHAMNFESIRTLAVAIMCLFLIPFIDFNFNKNSLILVYVVSLLGTVGILYAAKAYRHKEISLISPLASIRPAFVAILAAIFLAESLTIKQISGIGVLLISAYLLESDHHLSNLTAPIKTFLRSKHSLYFIFATFIFSICSILDKYILDIKITNIFTYFFFIWIFMAINFNIIHYFMYGIKDTKTGLKKATYLPFLVALFSVIANLLALKAISMAYVSRVVPVLMLSTLLIVLFGGRFFHERYLLFRLTISALMLIGAFLVIV